MTDHAEPARLRYIFAATALTTGIVVILAALGSGSAAHAGHPAAMKTPLTPGGQLDEFGVPLVTSTPTYPFQGSYTPPAQTPVVEIPPPAPLLVESPDTVNILLLGSDSYDLAYRRTDVMILLSIQRAAGTVALWHIPRDLFVYIPNYTMDRLNVAYAQGEMMGYPGGGFGLLQETFRYNFGLEVDHYARTNFTGFMEMVDKLGGLVISVDCPIEDWKLKDPALDPALEDSWEWYTLPVGRQRLSGDLALWYVRSRKTTSDQDRGRRQMDVLRALWLQARQQGLLDQFTELWPHLLAVTETDLTLDDVLPLVPLALSLDPAAVARYAGQEGVHYTRFLTPDNGRDVVLPNRAALLAMLQDLLIPSTANRLARRAATVEIVDASWYGLGFAQVVADRLAWDGFAARIVETPADIRRETTAIFDFTGQTKGSPLPDLMRVLRVDDAHVSRQPDPNRTVDFRIEIGTAYNTCKYGNAEDALPPFAAP